MRIRIAKNIPLILFLFTALSSPQINAKYRNIDFKKCNISKNSYDAIIEQVRAKNYNALTSPASCIRKNQKLVFEAITIDPKQLQYANPSFRNNENFVLRLAKINPEVIKYSGSKLRSNANFLQKSLFIYRDALKYSSKEIRDNLGFMTKAIKKDSRNYMFASKRIQKINKIATMAFSDNGNLILYAPEEVRENKKLVIIALKSSPDSFQFLSKKFRKDPEIIKIANYKDKKLSKEKLEKHILNHYIFISNKKSYEKEIDTNFANFQDRALVKRNYVTKWHKSYRLKGFYLKENWKLVSFDSRNPVPNWQKDMKDYPVLTKKITRFLKRRLIDNKTINNLYLTYLWEVNKDPKTLAVNLYLLRNSKDVELEDGYSNVTSLTAIARQTKDKKDWRLSVIEVIFDKEIPVNISFKNSHKKYFVQDLYVEDKNDKDPKVIFLVEDEYDSYFEIFSKMSGDKYQLSYRINPNEININKEYDLLDQFNIIRSRQDQEEYEWEHMMEDCRNDAKCAKKVN